MSLLPPSPISCLHVSLLRASKIVINLIRAFPRTRTHAFTTCDAAAVRGGAPAAVYVTIGQTKGKTLLPLPPTEEGGDGAKDKERIHVLESAVVTWTRQIKNVLKTDPESALKEPGEHPGPLAEVDFWAGKAQNLNSIYTQLSGQHIRKVVKVLEVTRVSARRPSRAPSGRLRPSI